MPDWGTGRVNDFLASPHNEPYEAIDPTKAALPPNATICIVGASRGIGAGCATAYAKAGASNLVLAARRRSGLESTASDCRAVAQNPKLAVEIVECDITRADSVAALADAIVKRFGRLDVVVVNSGYSGPVVLKLAETDPETFAQAMNVNYVGTFLCAKYLMPLLMRERSEKMATAFVVVSSMAAFIVRGPIANAQYCVSKAAQLKLAESLHEQYSAEEDGGVAVFAVHPGAVATEMALDSAPEVFREFLTDSPELCGAMCVWLTKDQEKKWLSGRLTSSKWDADELMKKKDEVVSKDLLKLGPVFQ